MLLIPRALLDPELQRVLLLLRELLVRLRGRHEVVFVRRDDALPDLALRKIARFDRKCAVLGRVGSFRRVEPQLGLALLRIKAVAREAVLREDGPDIAIVADGGTGGGQGRAASREP